MLTRRQFLRVGAGGAALLALARFGHAPARSGEAAALDRDARDVLGAVVPAILDGALPVDAAARAREIAATVERIDRSVAALPPHLQSELGMLFALLAFAPGRRLLAGVRAQWREASGSEVAAFLARWRDSRWSLQQQGYLALHELVLAAHYADEASWPRIGYPGPPALG